MSQTTLTISPYTSVSDAYDLMNKNPNSYGLTVVENGTPLGVVTKEKLALKLSGRYGFTLYQDKPIKILMDRHFLSFESDAPINIVSTIAMERPQERLYDFIVVTEKGKFLGTVTIKSMFQKALEMRVMTAQQQNPLTGLPGNTLIQQQMSQTIDHEEEFCIAYLDIDHFKAYNDTYGFEKGDAIIKLLADILNEYIPSHQFVGHIGGDDFVVIFNTIDNLDLLDEVKAIFETAVLNYYSEEDIANDFVTVVNRNGDVEETTLIGLTIVSVNNKEDFFQNIIEISESLAHKKTAAKREKIRNLKNRRK